MRGLYPIVDVELVGRTPLDAIEVLEAVLVVRPALVQLRAKHLNARDTLALLRAFKGRTGAVGTKLFANDRPDLAQLAGCDGIHLGQSDIAAAEVRRYFGNLMLGLSTHDSVQLALALQEQPDYVAYGPVFPTLSKQAPDPVVGLDGLGAAAELVRGRCPLVAIGGVTLDNAAAVAQVAEFGAVISALLPTAADSGQVTRRARELHCVLGGKSH